MKAVGVDIVKISRIKESLEKGSDLATRILTSKELEVWENRGVHQAAYLAKRFAAKEAISKALGTGIGQGISFQDIEVLNNEHGAPIAYLRSIAFDRMLAIGASQCLISLADEQEYAIAYATLV